MARRTISESTVARRPGSVTTRWVAEWLAANRSITYGLDAGEITLQDLMLSYLRFAKGHYGTGDTSEYHRLKYALRPLAALYSAIPVVSFGPQQYKAVRQRMVESGWARTNVNDSMKRILRMIKWGAADPAATYETLRPIPSPQRGRTEAKESKPVKPVCEGRVSKTIEHYSPVIADMEIPMPHLPTGRKRGKVFTTRDLPEEIFQRLLRSIRITRYRSQFY